MINTVLKKRLFPNGPLISPIGLGTLRFSLSDYENAFLTLYRAHQKGLNVFDSGLFYANGLSPFLLSRLPLTKDDLIFFKLSFVEANIGDVAWADWCENWFLKQIHTLFLLQGRFQTIVWLLDEPERILWKLKESHLSESLFEEKVFLLFRILERFCQSGLGSFFGLSSQVLGSGSQHPLSFFSQATFLKFVERFPHFKVIQAPLNWLESPFLLRKFSETLKEGRLGFVGIRPFNALTKRGDLLKFIKRDSWVRDCEEFRIWQELLQELQKVLEEAFEVSYPLATLSLFALARLPQVSCLITGMKCLSDLEEAMQSLQIHQLLKIETVYQTIQDHLYEMGF
jgi:aryl-alcohol dehydrogenase-like predicted oxidoreductase